MVKLINSNIEWIGLVPENWNIKPISSYFKERNEKVSDYDWEPLSVTKQGIVKQLDTAAKSDAHDSRKKVCKYDFVINSRSDRKQSCGVSPFDGSVSLINIVLEPRNICPRFVNYLLKNYGFAEEFYRYGSGIVADLWSINYQKMKKIMIPVPDNEEQLKIANFLDEKTQEIDNAINKTKETIEDYKKLKQSIITKIVTEGLDDSFKCQKTRLKNVAIIVRGGSPRPIDRFLTDSNDGVNWIKIGDTVKGNKYIDKTSQKIIKEGVKNSRYLTAGDLILTNSMSFGEPYILNIDGCIHDGWVAFSQLKGIKKEYLYYFLISDFCKKQFDEQVAGGVVQNLNVEKISKTIIYLPIMQEQIRIVEYLDKKSNEIDKLIAAKEKIVEELESYKKSVIYEYVTGKKEVK